VYSQDIQQRVSFDGIQAAIESGIGIIGVQGPNQLSIFLDNDPQSKIRGRRHMPAFKRPGSEEASR
jgi:hypothetical protein